MYEVRVDEKDLIWRFHTNQLRTKFAAFPLTWRERIDNYPAGIEYTKNLNQTDNASTECS